MLKILEKHGRPDVIVPINFGTAESVIKSAEWMNKKFGLTRFCFIGLRKGHRSTGYPDREKYISAAKEFSLARKRMAERGLSLGWFCSLTVKSGRSEKFTPIIRDDGSEHPFANCPMDETFASTLASDVAAFADIARPDFIFFEDDFSVSAAGGCLCPRHLSALEKKIGKHVDRETLTRILKQDTEDALEVRRAFAEVKRESLVYLATKIRVEVEKKSPEIPLGLMQTGAAYLDGDMTEAVARAFAGDRHTPFVRLFGTFYCGFKAKEVPRVMFNPLYQTEHLPPDVLCYHESDSYPHTRFYSSGVEMTALLSAAYSYGMVGSIFMVEELLQDSREEECYGRYFEKERKRLETLCKLAGNNEPFGVELTFDPFYHGTLGYGPSPAFTECVGRFGIPFTTKRASVAFWSLPQAKYSDGETVMQYLSSGLILDADGARALCERGYGKYLGVDVGMPLCEKHQGLVYDLDAKEIICDSFAEKDMGRDMWCAHAYCPAGGKEWMELILTDDRTETVTEAFDFLGNKLSPAMTYFENELGGKVCVISQSISDNHSQSIYNYRRMALIQRIISRMSDEYSYVKSSPDVYLIATKPKAKGEVLALLTLINLCTDKSEKTKIYLPKKLRCRGEILTINKQGELIPALVERYDDYICIEEPLGYCEPYYLILKGDNL